MSTVRPPLRTMTTFSGHLYTSFGWSLSSSQLHWMQITAFIFWTLGETRSTGGRPADAYSSW
jgi:hypothetical protein